MWRLFNRRLQNQLIPAFLIVLVVSIVPIIGYNLTIAREDSIEIVSASEVTNVEQQAEEIAVFLQYVNTQVLFLHDLPVMQSYAELADPTLDLQALCANDAGIDGVQINFSICTILKNIEQIFFLYSQNTGIYDQVRLLDETGKEIVRVNYANGQAVVATDFQDKSNRPYFQETRLLADREIYISTLDLNQERGAVEVPYKPVLRYGTPIYNAAGEFKGAIVVNVLAEQFLSFVIADDSTDKVYMIDQDGTYLVAPDPNLLFGRDLGQPELTFARNNPNDFEQVTTGDISGSFGDSEDVANTFTFYSRVQVPGQPQIQWTIFHQQPEDELLSAANQERNAILGIGAIAALIGIGVALFITRSIVVPVNRLSTAAARISQGDLNTPIPTVRRQDEIGTLRDSFEQMLRELQTSYSSLEARVQEATANLQTVVDVNNQIATILDTSRLLQDIVDITKERFRLYHAHIYLFDEKARQLELTAGAGHVGRQMVSEKRVIDFDNLKSIVARAARTRKSVVVNDVQVEGFLPHPLLPDTQAELAIPLLARGQVIGVLDVQNNQKGYFTPQIMTILELLGEQVARAISNARLYEEAERTGRRVQALDRITERMQTATSIDDILQLAVRELGKALRVPYAAIELSLDKTMLSAQEVSDDENGYAIEQEAKFQ